MLRLILPDTRYLDSYVAALREGYNSASYDPMPEENIQKIIDDPLAHFEMENSQGGLFTPEDGIQRKKVPHTKFWLVDDENFIGMAWVRYELNDFLINYAGHLGYGVRPSMRRKGYATKIIALACDKLKQRGIKRILITADQDNLPSWKAIEANGGVMESTVPSIYHKGGTTRRYWIELKD